MVSSPDNSLLEIAQYRLRGWPFFRPVSNNLADEIFLIPEERSIIMV
jgi:hypothetical protein